jgi:NAD-dependent dihydropyrimidine dehydrogenase PreA subunit
LVLINKILGGKIMARVITDECVKCGTCAANCPVGAISEGDSKFNIDKDTCIDCGACEADCPSSAIKAE